MSYYDEECDICGKKTLYWYYGCLGYEAIKCANCGEEYPL